MRYVLFICLAMIVGLASSAGKATAGEVIGYTGSAKDCLLRTGSAREVCDSMIDSVRRAMQGGRSYGDHRACSPHSLEDKQDTDAVIDWFRRHPERQDEDTDVLAREALSQLYPCSS